MNKRLFHNIYRIQQSNASAHKYHQHKTINRFLHNIQSSKILLLNKPLNSMRSIHFSAAIRKSGSGTKFGSESARSRMARKVNMACSNFEFDFSSSANRSKDQARPNMALADLGWWWRIAPKLLRASRGCYAEQTGRAVRPCVEVGCGGLGEIEEEKKKAREDINRNRHCTELEVCE